MRANKYTERFSRKWQQQQHFNVLSPMTLQTNPNTHSFDILTLANPQLHILPFGCTPAVRQKAEP